MQDSQRPAKLCVGKGVSAPVLFIARQVMNNTVVKS